ncbi:hypothetical protein Cci01nite_16700 [Catellatospora citrea]|uniref:AAA domain-containing protein n=1 Tax=Catellatospora citrea TaxID=53366 RepID=A0A8J3K4H2_9ACTN|nr:AAA domain-containing protein [Catellatospora citrea]GIF96576.1 hypothetical protein Cci01nite_16700 [Catellatospora citrea]
MVGDSRFGLYGPPALREHGRLRREVGRQFGQLRALFELIDQRPGEAEKTVTGIVAAIDDAPASGSLITIRVDDGSPLTDFDRRSVRVRDDSGMSFNSSVAAARGRRLDVRQPRRITPRIGAPVFVDLVKPFSQKQNALALRNFLDGDVEGSWENLARLMSRPAGLTVPKPFQPPEHFFCDDDPQSCELNEQQRKAVTGAVSTPHTFFIQGPPGTGKTEVICEVARQLTSRGERVLLLAPSHVAVDEVLSRIGRKPGIRALRITWSDDRVQENLHGYLESNVGGDLAEQVLRPEGGGQNVRWARELEEVDARISAVDRSRHLRAQTMHQTNQVAAARVALATANTNWEQQRDTFARLDDELTAEVDAAQTRRAQTAAAWEHSKAQLDNSNASRRSMMALARAVRAWSTIDAQAQAANSDAIAAEDEATRMAADAKVRHETAVAIAARHEQLLQAREAELAEAKARSAQARAEVERARAAQTDIGRVLQKVSIGALPAAQRRLRAAMGSVTESQVLVRQFSAMADDAAAALRTAERALTTGVPSAATHAAQARTAAQAAHAEADLAWAALARSAGQAGADPVQINQVDDRAVLAGQLMRAIAAAFSSVARDVPITVPVAGIEPLTARLKAVVHWHHAAATAQQQARQAGSEYTQAQVRAAEQRAAADTALRAAVRTRDDAQRRLDQVTRRLQEAEAGLAELDDSAADDDETISRLSRRRHVLARLPALHERWCELTAKRSDDQIVTDIRESMIRGANLVCATTKGIAGRGSDVVRHADYDTLIVDEASRVTESEFLIGAVRARRWVMVGDEHQLPPYVQQQEEHFLHALTALYRHHRGTSPTLEGAVEELSGLWHQDEEQHKFRVQSVLGVANTLLSDGLWTQTYREQFQSAYERLDTETEAEDPDRRVLKTMLRHFVHSLFQTAVLNCPPQLRQELVWQRRMIEPLARIVNEPVYAGRYHTPPQEQLQQLGVVPLIAGGTLTRPIIFADTSAYRDAGDEPRLNGFVNQREQLIVERICELYNESLGKTGAPPVSVSVLAFYRAQAQALERKLKARDFPQLQWEVIDVIDRIQGQQSDLVIVSFTRARASGRTGPQYGQWLQDIRRLNVAFTRARRGLVLVGHNTTLRGLGQPVAGQHPGPARHFYQNLFHLIDTDDNFLRVRRI